MDLTIGTRTGHHRIDFEEFFEIRGFSLNRQGKTHEGIEERMQNAKHGMVERCADLQKQRRAVESEVQQDGGTCLLRLFFGSENWSLSQAALDRIKAWETKAMRRLVRFKREEDEMWAEYCRRTARVARKIWTKMKLPFLSESDC